MKYIYAYFNAIKVFLIFLGSVFLTSEKFIDTEYSAKFYFTILIGFVGVIIFCAKSKNIKTQLIKLRESSVLIGLYAVVVMQAGFGVLQYIGMFSSNHYAHSITGSFDNPAGFAAVLSMGFPIGLYLLFKTKIIERYFVLSLILIAITMFLSGSRTGILAIIISSFTFFLSQINILGKFQKLRYYKIIVAIVFALITLSSFALYHQKKDSANGRLLIWKVSSEMIKEKPVLGHGYGAFKAKYMNYQAEYLKNNFNSKYSQLADNVKHPFNEIIKVAIEFGIVGLAIILLFTILIFRKITKSKSEVKPLILSGLSSFLVFASFSYPLQYIAIWLLLTFYLFILLPSKEIKIRNSPVSMITRVVIVIICVFSFIHTYQQIRAEIKWKKIAENSLNGKTEEMLPEYEKLYSTSFKRNPFFLYNYGAELNFVGKFDESINILTECEQRFNDYDLQMILADNYHKKGEIKKAIELYRHASFMIPCRFLPFYQLFEIYRKAGQKDMAVKYARVIINKKVKIPSLTINSIKAEAEEYLKENEITFGNTRS